MKEFTNILVGVHRPSAHFTERFVLPQFRGEMNRIYSMTVKHEEMIGVPIMTCLDDKLWCNDDPVFMLERMMWNGGVDELEYIRMVSGEYLEREWCGEERTLHLDDGVIRFTKDRSDLSHLRAINVETNRFIDEAQLTRNGKC